MWWAKIGELHEFYGAYSDLWNKLKEDGIKNFKTPQSFVAMKLLNLGDAKLLARLLQNQAVNEIYKEYTKAVPYPKLAPFIHAILPLEDSQLVDKLLLFPDVNQVITAGKSFFSSGYSNMAAFMNKCDQFNFDKTDDALVKSAMASLNRSQTQTIFVLLGCKSQTHIEWFVENILKGQKLDSSKWPKKEQHLRLNLINLFLRNHGLQGTDLYKRIL